MHHSYRVQKLSQRADDRRVVKEAREIIYHKDLLATDASARLSIIFLKWKQYYATATSSFSWRHERLKRPKVKSLRLFAAFKFVCWHTWLKRSEREKTLCFFFSLSFLFALSFLLANINHVPLRKRDIVTIRSTWEHFQAGIAFPRAFRCISRPEIRNDASKGPYTMPGNKQNMIREQKYIKYYYILKLVEQNKFYIYAYAYIYKYNAILYFYDDLTLLQIELYTCINS